MESRWSQEGRATQAPQRPIVNRFELDPNPNKRRFLLWFVLAAGGLAAGSRQLRAGSEI